MTIKLQFQHHGAVNGVTGSCHQLHINQENSLLVDCGLFQGAEIAGGASANQLAIDFDISIVNALLVTHSHIDHVGRIPYLLAAGFRGPIIATEATAALLPLVLEDALKVGVTRDERLISACIRQLQKQLVAVPYKQWHKVFDIGDINCRIKFQPAGHILGSAFVEVDIKNSEDQHRVVFSGDLGAPYAPLLPAPRSPYRADTLIIESTYGDKNHASRRNRIRHLEGILERAIADNGVVLIPAFSMGRTQELLYEIEQIQHKAKFRKLKNLEVIVDSPLAARFTEKYQHFRTLWDAEARRKVASGRHPLNFDNLYTIDSHQEHMACLNYLSKRNKPAIVIAASGMCSGGRIINYLNRFLSEPSADVLFVGYQASGTTGREIQKYGPRGGYVVLDGKRIDIKAQVHSISGYSAHADQTNLINFVKRMRYQPKQIRIVHGDSNAKQVLAKRFREVLADVDVFIPSS